MEFNNANQLGANGDDDDAEILVVAVYSAADVEQRRLHRLELDAAHLVAANFRVALRQAEAVIAQRDAALERAEVVIAQRDAALEQASVDLAQSDLALEQATLDLAQSDHALEHARAHTQDTQEENVDLVAQLADVNERHDENRDALAEFREVAQRQFGEMRRIIDQHEHMECVICLTPYVELNLIGIYFFFYYL